MSDPFSAAAAAYGSFTGSSQLQKEAAAAQLHLFKRRHQFEAEDLEKAGLNRILGYSKGSSPSVSPVGVPSFRVDPPDTLGSAQKAAMMGATVQAAKMAAFTSVSTARGAAHAATRAGHETEGASEVTARAKMENFERAQRMAWHATPAGRTAIQKNEKLRLELEPWKGVDWQKALMSAGSGMDSNDIAEWFKKVFGPIGDINR